MNIVKQNETAEINFPTLDRFIEVYPKLLSNYLKEYKDNSERRFIELSIEHYKTYGDEFLNKEDLTFNKYAVERLFTSRLAIVNYLENRLKSFPTYKTKKTKGCKKMNLDIESKNLYSDVFSNNGFELFQLILKEYVKPIGKRGRESDLIFFFWKLYLESPKYIHAKPTDFFRWFDKKYDNTFGQLKTLNQVETIQRNKDYSSALMSFKRKDS